MSAYPFGCAFYNNVCTVFKWSEKVSARTESIVYDQRQIILLSKCSEFFKIGDIELRVADGFEIDGLGIFVDQRHKTFNVVTVGKPGFDAEAFKRYLELVV